MRNRISSKLWRRVLALGALFLPFLLIGCGSTDDDDPMGPLTEGFVVPLNENNASLLNGATLDFIGGLPLFNLTNGASFSLTFNNIGPDTGIFTLNNNDRIAAGNVVFVASCEFTTDTSQFAPDTGPQEDETINFSNCNGIIQSNVNVGEVGTGTLALDLTRQQGGQQARSNPIEVTVEVTAAGAVLINSVDTGETVSVSN